MRHRHFIFMKALMISYAIVLVLVVGTPALAFQTHPKPQKVAKHKTHGDHHHHYFWQKNK